MPVRQLALGSLTTLGDLNLEVLAGTAGLFARSLGLSVGLVAQALRL